MWIRDVVFAVLVLWVPALHAVSLKDIPSLVRSTNVEVKSSQKDVEAASSAIWTARSRAYPSLNLQNTYVHIGEDIRITPTQNLSITFQAQDVMFTGLMLKMPLYTGGRITAGISAAQAKKKEAEAEHSKTSESKVQEALIRYLGVQVARKAQGILEQMSTHLERMETIASSLVKTGLGTKFAVMQVQVARAELKSRLVEAAGKAKVADLAFKVSIGNEGSEALHYETPLKPPRVPTDGETFRSAALKTRAEFKILESKSEQVSALRSVTIGKMLPALYAVGNYQIYKYNMPLLQPNWAVGVVLDIPITGFLEALPEREAAIRLDEKVQLQTERARTEIPLLIEKLFSELSSLNASAEAMGDATRLAQEGLRLSEVRFKSGNGSVLEVLKSSTDLETTQIKQVQLIYELNNKLIELYAASGDVSGFLEAYEK